MAVTAVAVEVMTEALRAVPRIAAVLVVAAVAVGCTALTPLALVSGRQDRCKALCSCFAPSNKPCLRGTWSLTCSKGNEHKN